MTFRVRFTRAAETDLLRLFDFAIEQADGDCSLAEKALDAIKQAMVLLEHSPFSCRKAETDTPFMRELVIPFGSTGYVALFEIEDSKKVTVLAVRHQREDDYH